jgi:hypothetical protein
MVVILIQAPFNHQLKCTTMDILQKYQVQKSKFKFKYQYHSCSLGNPVETVASTTSTVSVEYQTMISCTTKLRTAVCHDLVQLSGYLLEKGLISQESDSGLRNRSVEEVDRAARLVDLIQQKVKLDSRNYVQFTSILEEDKHHYSDILRILKEAYSLLAQGKDSYLHACI